MIRKILFLNVMLLVSSFFMGCKQQGKNEKEIPSITYRSLSLEDELFLFGNKKHLGGTLSINIKYPVIEQDEARSQGLQKCFSEAVFGENFKDLLIEKAAESYRDSFRLNKGVWEENYLFMKKMAEEDGFDMRDSLNYAVMITDSIVYDQNNLLSFQVTNYSYEGGAHGGMSLLCYLLTTDGKRLYESDLFIDDYYDVLKEILVQKILKQNKVETLDALSELGYINTDGIVPNGNFYLSEGGITYVYGQYEIACYAMGISEVYLPFAEIKHLLKENTPLTPLL